MTKPRLPYRIDSLDRVPSNFHGAYEPDPRGGFVLQVDGMTPVEPPAPPAAGSARSQVEKLRAALVESVLLRLQPRADAREKLAAQIAKQIVVHEVAGEPPRIEFQHETGYPMPSSIAGQTFVQDIDEFALKLGNSEVVKAALPPVAPPPKSREQLATEDSETYTPPPKNQQLRHGYSQRDFEAATKLAQERGGVVLFPKAEEAPAPTLDYRPGKDVRIPAGSSQDDFERAMRLAQKNGGELILIEAPAEAGPSEADIAAGEARASAAGQRGAWGR